MDLTIQIGIYNTWIFSSVYLVLNLGLILLFPKYNVNKLVKTPKVKILTNISYVLYFGFFISSIFTPINIENKILYIGLGIYIIGLFLYTISMFSFAVSEFGMLVTEKMYKYSRHPIYVSFFLILIGISLTGGSILLLLISVLHFGISIVFMIKEEKECEKNFGSAYIDYKRKVRRII